MVSVPEVRVRSDWMMTNSDSLRMGGVFRSGITLDRSGGMSVRCEV